LVSNAVIHGAGPIRVSMAASERRVSLAVADSGSGAVVKPAFSLTRECGRGLRIVEALSDDWGFEWIPGDGTVVWSELEMA
jgi:two-component sensor histidine kinase